MYESYYGLKRQPFSPQPDPEYCYKGLPQQLCEARMRFAAEASDGVPHALIACVLGDAGTGKSSLANELVADWSSDPTKNVAYLPSASERGRSPFARRVLEAFGLEGKRNYADNRKILENYLYQQHKAGKHSLIVIDECQSLDPQSLDCLVEWSNIRTMEANFLTALLFGQRSFTNKIRSTGKEAFVSRVGYVGHMDPLSGPDEVAAMIAHRWRVAGGQVEVVDGKPSLGSLIAPEAVADVFRATRGYPREIVHLMGDLIMQGYLIDERPITSEAVAAAVRNGAGVKPWSLED